MTFTKTCKNSFTTSRGTYTFYEEEMNKAEAKQFCENKGQILAPITSKGEFDKVHRYASSCGNLGGWNFYHIGFYVFKKDVKLFSNCEKWNSAEHEGLFDWYMEDGPCYRTYYSPNDNIMSVEPDLYCSDIKVSRPICFKAADNQNNNSEALVNSEVSNISISPRCLTAVVVLVAMGFCSMAVAIFILVGKLKNLKQKLPVSIN